MISQSIRRFKGVSIGIVRAVACLCLLAAHPAFAANKLFIKEYSKLAVTANGIQPPIAPEPALVEQSPVDFSSGAASSAAFGATTTYVVIQCDTRCSYKVGASPQTATTSNFPLAADQPWGMGVTPGQVVSVVASP